MSEQQFVEATMFLNISIYNLLKCSIHPSIHPVFTGSRGVRCIPVVVLKRIIENFTQKRHFWSLKIAVLKNSFQEEKFEKPYVD